MYEYRATPLKVVDGDTIAFDIDLGLHVHKHETIRLLGVDTPELNSSDPAERERAKSAKLFVEAALMTTGPAPTVQIRTEKPYPQDKYGRMLGRVYYRYPADAAGEWRYLNEELISAGLARAYDGGKR